MGGLVGRACLLAAALCGLSIIAIPTLAADPCVEINFQTRAENRLKAGHLIERRVGVFFAGETVNTLSVAEKTSIEAEFDRFFHAFRSVFIERKYVWNANADMVRRAQVQFNYIVVIDAQLNTDALPKYDENLNMYKGKLIDPDLIGFVDYVAPKRNENIPVAFAQVVDAGPAEAYLMFAEILLLAVGVETTVIHSDYAASLQGYVAGSVTDSGEIGVLRQQHENLVYSCLASVFD